MTDRIGVEVAYARPERQQVIALKVAPGTTAAQAVACSGILEQFPELAPAALKLGIFSKPVRPDAALREGDRVEIYRPLLADPKEVRRRRAESGKAMKKGRGEREA